MYKYKINIKKIYKISNINEISDTESTFVTSSFVHCLIFCNVYNKTVASRSDCSYF